MRASHKLWLVIYLLLTIFINYKTCVHISSLDFEQPYYMYLFQVNLVILFVFIINWIINISLIGYFTIRYVSDFNNWFDGQLNKQKKMKRFLTILILLCFIFYGSWYLFEFVNPLYGLFGVALTFGIIIDQIHKTLKKNKQ